MIDEAESNRFTGAARDRSRLLLIELNEVNRELLAQAAAQLHLRYVERLLALSECATFSRDDYDSGYLEPWVQWVSVHTGKPSSEHRIMHLGDVPKLDAPQIWEVLSSNGVTSGIWGIMNGDRREACGCLFFVADPWTFGVAPYPAELSGLTDFAAYIAKHYLELSPPVVARHAFTYGLSLLRHLSAAQLGAATTILLEGVCRFGPTNAVLGAFYEYTSSCAFFNARKKYRPDFSILFLNLIAHMQHHYWSAGPVSAQLAFGFKVIDRILAMAFSQIGDDDALLAANGLSQTNTNAEDPWILYRQKSPQRFLSDVGVETERVEALMTHDSHVFFAGRPERDSALAVLAAATVAGQPLFYVEGDERDPARLFYRLSFTGDLPAGAEFELGGRRLPFYDHFDRVVRRTGKHCQDGFVFQNKELLPARLENHLINAHILGHFGIDAAAPAAPVESTTR